MHWENLELKIPKHLWNILYPGSISLCVSFGSRPDTGLASDVPNHQVSIWGSSHRLLSAIWIDTGTPNLRRQATGLLSTSTCPVVYNIENVEHVPLTCFFFFFVFMFRFLDSWHISGTSFKQTSKTNKYIQIQWICIATSHVYRTSFRVKIIASSTPNHTTDSCTTESSQKPICRPKHPLCDTVSMPFPVFEEPTGPVCPSILQVHRWVSKSHTLATTQNWTVFWARR